MSAHSSSVGIVWANASKDSTETGITSTILSTAKPPGIRLSSGGWLAGIGIISSGAAILLCLVLKPKNTPKPAVWQHNYNSDSPKLRTWMQRQAPARNVLRCIDNTPKEYRSWQHSDAPRTLAEWRAALASRPEWCETLGVDSLQDILGKKDFTPPDEITAVKDFISRRYNSPSQVRVERDALIVRVPSSALAATLQLEQRTMIEKCRITRRLIIRYGR